MSEEHVPTPLEIVIEVDTSRFDKALRDLINAWGGLGFRTRHGIYALAHPGARHRSRVVTRRKQRRAW